jgi:hypothetical protein
MEKYSEQEIRAMLDKLSPEERNEMLFMNLIMMLQMSAWSSLGKMPNPETNKTEKNLDAARSTIDMLLMIQAKTLNNLGTKEKEFLDTSVRELQLAFLQESK